MNTVNCPSCGVHIDQHLASRCLDEWVGRAVMGDWDKMLESAFHLMIPESAVMPRYSIDIREAWRVVEYVWLEEDSSFDYPLFIGRDFFLEYWQDGEFFVATKPVGVRDGAILAHCDGKKTGRPSAPLAICRAAIKVALYGEEKK